MLCSSITVKRSIANAPNEVGISFESSQPLQMVFDTKTNNKTKTSKQIQDPAKKRKNKQTNKTWPKYKAKDKNPLKILKVYINK